MKETNERNGLSLLRRSQLTDSDENSVSQDDREENLHDSSLSERNVNEMESSAELYSPVSPDALEDEMKGVLSSLWNFKEILIEFKSSLQINCDVSIQKVSEDLKVLTKTMDIFNEKFHLNSSQIEKVESVKGINEKIASEIEKISSISSKEEAILEIIEKLGPVINTYGDMIEKFSLLEDNLQTFFRKQKTGDQLKQEQKANQLLPGSSAIIRSQELERQRIAREIHDGPAQAMANVIFRLDIMAKMMKQSPDTIPEEMDKVKEIAQGALNEIRSFIFDLRPMTLQDLGLTATLKKIINQGSGKSRTKVELLIEGDEKELDPSIDLAIFRIAQESLNNILKHADAARAWVQLKYFEDKVVLIVEDNGKGFNIKAKKQQNIEEYQSFGLIGMQERADDINATLQLTSQPMRGTKVILTVSLY